MKSLDQIRNLIVGDKVNEAITETLNLLEKKDRKSRDLRDEVIVLGSKLKGLKKQDNMGLLNNEELLREKAKINSGLLNIINQVEKEETLPDDIIERQESINPKRWWWLLLLLIPIGVYFILNPPWTLPSLSDLAFEGYKWTPNPVIRNQPAKILFEIKNDGPDDALNFEVTWWANIQDRQATKKWNVDRLKTGSKKKNDFEYTWSGISTNSLQTKIVIDPTQKLRDPNLQNNNWQRQITLKESQPVTNLTNERSDLRVRAWQCYPNPVVLGQNTDVMFDIINDGPNTARDFKVYWYASSSDTQPTKAWDISSLAVGAKRSIEFQHTWVSSGAGSLRFKVLIDPEQKLAESNRANNQRIVNVPIQ